MNLLRRLPLSRLVALCVAVVALGTGVAVASSIGTGPTPPPASLPDAIHQALTAAPVAGVTANVTLTDSLLPSGTGGPGSPLLSGGHGRIWVTADGRARLELQSDSGDTEIYYANGTLSYLDPRNGGTLYHVMLPQRSGDSSSAESHTPPSVNAISQAISRLGRRVSISGAIPSDVAGQPAYEVRVSPASNGGLVGGAALWWDANHGVPLQVAVYAVNNPDPVIDLSATSVSYGPIDASKVFTPPTVARTQTIDLSSSGSRHPGTGGDGTTGSTTFTAPAAPASLGGQTLTSQRSVHVNGKPAQLFFYGQGLGGIAVLESAAKPGGAGGAPGDSSSGPSLPTISINGVSATEIPTALGTLIHFTRGGTSYTVVGSVPAADAVRAAEGL